MSHNDFATVREMKYTSQHCSDKTTNDKMAFNRECYFPNCAKSRWIKLLSFVSGDDPPPRGSAPGWSRSEIFSVYRSRVIPVAFMKSKFALTG